MRGAGKLRQDRLGFAGQNSIGSRTRREDTVIDLNADRTSPSKKNRRAEATVNGKAGSLNQ